MKIRKNVLRQLMTSPYIVAFAAIVMIGLILYAPFLFGNYIFAYSDWGYDTKHSYLAIYEFYVNKLSGLRFSEYDFSYGPGTTIFDNFPFLADPFGLFVIMGGVLLGIQKVGLLLVYSLFLKNITIGLFGVKYLRMLKFSKKSAVFGGTVLAFCGYLFITGQHYSFATYAVLYMLALIMMERYIANEKKWGGLVLVLAWQGIIGPYYMFYSLLGLGVYCVIRYSMREHTVKTVIIRLLKTLVLVFAAIGLSMVSFLPQCYQLLTVSSRIEDGVSMMDNIKASFGLLDGIFLKSGFLRLYSANIEGLINDEIWTSSKIYYSTTPYCFSLLLPFCIVHQFTKLFTVQKMKERLVRIAIFAIVIFTTCFAFIPSMTNMFTSIQFRFAFVLLPVELVCIAESIDDIYAKKVNIWFNSIVTIVISFVGVWLLLDDSNALSRRIYYIICIAMVLIAVSECLLWYGKKEWFRRGVCIILFGVVILPTMYDVRVSLYRDRMLMKKKEIEYYQMPQYEHFIDKLNKLEGDNFYRIEKDYAGVDGSSDYGHGFICPSRTLAAYNSTLSKSLGYFSQNITGTTILSSANYSVGAYGKPYDTTIANILGLKYIISMHKGEHEGWTRMDKYNGFYLFRNDSFKSSALLSDCFVTEKDYAGLTNVMKDEVLERGVVLEDNVQLEGYRRISAEDFYMKPEDGNSLEGNDVDMISPRADSEIEEVSNPNFGSRVQVKVNNKDKRILYCPIVYDDNWKVYVNGEEHNVLKANYGFVAVALEAGDNNVEFVYKNKSLYLGCIISLLSGIILVIVGLYKPKVHAIAGH